MRKGVTMGGRNALIMRRGSIAIFILACLPAGLGHGYMSQPVSRNYFEYLNNRFWNRKDPAWD